jgi:hypothetical protein
MSTRMPTDLDTLYLDAAQTNALIADPEKEIRALGLTKFQGILPIIAGYETGTRDPVSADVTDDTMTVVIVNRTDAPLDVEACETIDGSLLWAAWDDRTKDSRIAAAPIELFGEGASCVGIWTFTAGPHNPAFTIKFSATKRTGNKPVYVAGDFTAEFFKNVLSCSVGNDELGSAKDYYTRFIDASGAPDYGAAKSASGCVSASVKQSEYLFGRGSEFFVWVICAVVGGD